MRSTDNVQEKYFLKQVTKSKRYNLIVIGGGAAGFYTAINVARHNPSFSVLILEKTSKLLTKVKVSGGGRCNVTHHCYDPIQLARHYPRGSKPLKTLFKKHQALDVVSWFSKNGVKLKSEDDGRMFPVTDNSQTIIDCFLNEARKNRIEIRTNTQVVSLRKEDQNDYFVITTQEGGDFLSSKVLIATGGNPKREAYQWIEKLGHTIEVPKPSLFTFNDSDKKFKDLMGVSVSGAQVRIAGTKFLQQGPILITHWGLSGPAVIKLSAWAAEYLHEINYQFTALVSWVGEIKDVDLRSRLYVEMKNHGLRKIVTNPLFGLSQRLWQRLCDLAEIPEEKIWAELPQRNCNKLSESLLRCPFQIKGKTTFKEEFVTCGGVKLNEIDLERMESKKMKNLFFAGEVLNIDGETGGFNFQSAWTTAFIAATAISE